MGRNRVNVAVFAGFSLVCLGALAYLALSVGLRLPGQSGYLLNADFRDASGLVPQDEVRIAGVKVGSVTGLSAGPNGSTEVAMQLDKGYQVRNDTRAVIRPKSLLGTTFVELIRIPASASPSLPSGATIPLARTGQAVQIDAVLNNLDAPTRQAMSDSLQQLGVALDGRAGDLNSSVGSIDQVATNLRPLAQVGDRRTEELARILVDLDTIMQALADEQDSLGRLVDSGNTVFSGIAQRDQDLAGAIQNANGFLGSLDSAFSSAGVTAADRTSLAAAPGTISASSHTLSLTNAGVDQLIPELLLGQVNYPNDQLSVSNDESARLAREWISAFFQSNSCADPGVATSTCHSFRITNITALPGLTPAAPPTTLPGLPPLPLPTAVPLPVPTPTDPLCRLVGGIC
jgi:phospholipid/cholesterol/gamma-HCH transport system substrate-binding protein